MWLGGAGATTRVLLAADAGGVPDLENAASIAEDPVADETGWTEVTIPVQPRPVGSTWVLLEAFPAAALSATDRGVAHCAIAAAVAAICGDGVEEWGLLTGVTLVVESAFEVTGERMGKCAPPVTIEEVRKPVVLGVRPNPTHDTTTFQFVHAAEGVAQVDIFDVRGRRVQTVAGQLLTAGQRAPACNARAGNGSRVDRGTWFARLTAPGLATRVRVLLHP